MECIHVYNGVELTEDELKDVLADESYDPVIDTEDEDIFSSAVASPPVANLGGGFAKVVELKQKLLAKAKANVHNARIKMEENKSVASEYLKWSTKVTQLNEYIYGNKQKQIKGLINEIEDLKKLDARSPEILAPYIEKELTRLDTLVASTDPVDYREAKDIVAFIISLGTFDAKQEHPIFTNDELYDDKGNDIFFTQVPHYKAIMEDWRKRALEKGNNLTTTGKKIVEKLFNENALIKKHIGKELTWEQIQTAVDNELAMNPDGLKDISWLDREIMDIADGILSTPSLLMQVIKSEVSRVTERHHVWSKGVAERVDEQVHNLQKELRSLGFSSNFLGIKGSDYSLFKQKFTNGKATGNVVQKFSKLWQEDYDAFTEKLQEYIKDAFKSKSNVQSDGVYKGRNKWLKANTHIVNPFRLGLVDPANVDQTYVDNMQNLLGEYKYGEIVEQQNRLLKEYDSALQQQINYFLVKEGALDEAALSDFAKDNIEVFKLQHSPENAIKYLNSGIPLVAVLSTGTNKQVHSSLEYNAVVPKAKNDKGESTGYYDDNFKTIEDNETLMKFYKLMRNTLNDIHKRLDNDAREKVSPESILGIRKVATDILIDRNLRILQKISAVFHKMIDNLRSHFLVREQSEFARAEDANIITGLKEYKVNDSFIASNKNKINDLNRLYNQQILHSYNTSIYNHIKSLSDSEVISYSNSFGFQTTGKTINSLKGLLRIYLSEKEFDKYTVLKYNGITKDVIASVLSTALGVTNADLNNKEFLKEVPDTKDPSKMIVSLKVGKMVQRHVEAEVAEDQSYDLPRMLKFYSDAAATYAAKTELLPTMEIIKKQYEEVKKLKTQNTNKKIINKNLKARIDPNVRYNAVTQFDSYFERAILDNHGITKHFNLTKKRFTNEAEKQRYEMLTNSIKVLGERINIEKDTNKVKMLNAELNELIDEREKLGGQFAVSAALQAIFVKFVRSKSLSWNISSGINNVVEGQQANMITAEQEAYFPRAFIDTITPQEMIYNDLKARPNDQWRSPKDAKARLIIKRYNLLQDNTDDLQKATAKSSYTEMLNMVNPFAMIQRGELYNQTPLAVAMLRNTQITGQDAAGNPILSNVWDALDAEWDADDKIWKLKLKPGYDSKENKANWLDSNGDTYAEYKYKTDECIASTHGDFNKLSGIKAKDSVVGQMALVFKGWLPKMLARQYGVRRYDLNTNKYRKGIMRSLTPTSGAFWFGAVSMAAFGPALFTAGVGIATGITVSKLWGANSEMGAMGESVLMLKLLLRKLAGMPLIRVPVNLTNSMFNGKLVPDLNKKEMMVKMLRKDGKNPTRSFREEDVHNFCAIAQQLATLMVLKALELAVRAIGWDDDDDKDDVRRKTHNILVNELMQLSGSLTQYSNPVQMPKMAIPAGFRLMTDITKTLVDVTATIDGHPRLTTGVNAGKLKVVNDAKKLLPGIFGFDWLGMQRTASVQFEDDGLQKYFWGDEKKAQTKVREMKAARKYYLKEKEGKTEEEANDIIKEEYPRKSKDESQVDHLKTIEQMNKAREDAEDDDE